jgi:hypothetical protein
VDDDGGFGAADGRPGDIFQAELEVGVLAEGQAEALIEAAGGLQEFAADEGVAGEELRPFKVRDVLLEVGGLGREGDEHLAGDGRSIAGTQSADTLADPFIAGGEGVVIDESDHLAGGGLPAGVAGGGRPSAPPTEDQDLHLGIAQSDLADGFGSCGRVRIVDDHNLERFGGPVLREHGFETALEEVVALVRGNDHADGWRAARNVVRRGRHPTASARPKPIRPAKSLMVPARPSSSGTIGCQL